MDLQPVYNNCGSPKHGFDNRDKESRKKMIKILFVCRGTTLTDAGNLDDSKIFSDDISYLQLLYNI